MLEPKEKKGKCSYEPMKKYINIKLVDAVACRDTQKLCGNYQQETKGYKVAYKNKYFSWCSKELFETINFPIEDGNKITESDAVNMINQVQVTTIDRMTTFVYVTLLNGFTLTETSSCINPISYSEKIGTDICMEKVVNKVRFLLEFLLQTAQNGFMLERERKIH